MSQIVDTAARPQRADKAARAALHNFEKNFAGRLKQSFERRCVASATDSVFARVRADEPIALLWFLFQVLQCQVVSFWKAAAKNDPYVKSVSKIYDGKVPPSIIAILAYLHEEPVQVNLQDMRYVPTQEDKTDILTSEMGRANAGSSKAKGSTEVSNDDETWGSVYSSLLRHVVMPLVEAGIVSGPADPNKDCHWWNEHVVHLLDDHRVYSLAYTGGKKKAKASWYYVCDALRSLEFPTAYAGMVKEVQKISVEDFLRRGGLSATVMPAMPPDPASSSEPSETITLASSASNAANENKDEETVQKNLAMRWSYTVLDQRAREMIGNAKLGVVDVAHCNGVLAAWTEKPRETKLMIAAVAMEIKISMEDLVKLSLIHI